MVSSHSAHGVATGDEYCIEIMMNYRYMLLSCMTLHLWMLHGASNFLARHLFPYAHEQWTTLPIKPTGKALSRLSLMSLTGVLVVGRPGVDVWGVVPPLGVGGDSWWPIVASNLGNGSCSGITLWFQAGSKQLSGPLYPNAPSILFCAFPRPASPTSSTYPVGCPSPT